MTFMASMCFEKLYFGPRKYIAYTAVDVYRRKIALHLNEIKNSIKSTHTPRRTVPSMFNEGHSG